MSVRDSLIAILVAFLWGAQVTAVKIGDIEIPPILMVTMRFAIMSLVLVPFIGLPKKGQWLPVLTIATLTGAVHFGLLYSGIARVDASTSAIAYQLATPFSIMLAYFVLGERISRNVVIGILLAFAGVLTVVGSLGKGGALFGILLVILAAFSFAAGTVVTKKSGGFNPLAMNGWIALISVPELLLISYLTEYGQWHTVLNASMQAWAAVLYTAFSGGLIGFGLWYWLLKRHPVHRLSPFTLLVPVFAVTVSQIILNEKMTINLIAGGVIALAGVALCQMSFNQKPAKEMTPVSATAD